MDPELDLLNSRIAEAVIRRGRQAEPKDTDFGRVEQYEHTLPQEIRIREKLRPLYISAVKVMRCVVNPGPNESYRDAIFYRIRWKKTSPRWTVLGEFFVFKKSPRQLSKIINALTK